MSKALEFGPDEDSKPRKAQAVEISGSQLSVLLMFLLEIWGLVWGEKGAGLSLPGGEKLQGELCTENRLEIKFGVSRRRNG